jgi:putative acetyltransferase
MSSMDHWTITAGFAECHREALVALLREYEASIGVSLCFQAFEAELDGLPGAYQPPGGEFLIARHAGMELVGCVAVRPAGGTGKVCEMKRLYVRDCARGTGLGRNLALAAMTHARRLGYTRMCLDTLPTMTAAQALYRSLGFRYTGSSPTAITGQTTGQTIGHSLGQTTDLTTGLTADLPPRVLLFECALN